MAGEWTAVELGEVVDLVTGFPFKSDSYLENGYDKHAPRLLRGDNVAQGYLRWDGARQWPVTATEGLDQYWVREGDVIVAMDRPWIDAGLKYASVRDSDLPALLVQRVARLRGSERLDTGFLRYLIGSQGFTDHVLAVQTGTAVPHISGAQIKSFKFSLPPLSEQRALAHILRTLDDKIELNRRMSETLGAMARALFKSWFIDFAPVRAKAEDSTPGLPKNLADIFPGRLVDSSLGEIPEGWAVCSLGDLADLDKGLSYKGEGLVDEGGLPLVNLGCFAGEGRFKSESVKRYRGEYRNRHVARPGDLLIANTDMTQNRVILGSPALLPDLDGERQYLFTHHTFAVRFKSDAEQWKQYVYFSLLRPEFREVAEGYATGTTVLALPRDGVLRYQLVLPPEGLRATFDRCAAALLARTDAGNRESSVLAALRDGLLPKLISGELSLADAEGVADKVCA